MRVAVITPPSTEPVTSTEVKLALHIDDSTEDALITSWIKTGRELAEGFLRRALITQTIEATYDDFPCVPVLLPRSPVQSITSITYYDTDNVSATVDLNTLIIDTSCEPARIDLGYGEIWPASVLRPMSSVKIRYVAGYGATAASVPATIKDAITLYCGYRNESRVGEVAEVPRHFYDLLRPDRIYL